MSWYALASIRRADELHTALQLGDRHFDLAAAARAFGVDGNWSNCSVDELLEKWPQSSALIAELAERAARSVDSLEPVAVDSHDIAPPFRPERFFCAAANYAEHAREMGTKLAAKSERSPYMFMKPGSALIGNNDTVVLPAASKQVDWEIELGVVMGRETRSVSVRDALDFVAGYTIVNDVTARDLNICDDYPFGTDWLRGKCFDTFAPMGPCFVPAACIDDPQDLHLQLSVNDEVMQDSTTAAMIYDISEQIAYLSEILTLRPGDVIATGTPTGVGMGRGLFLAPGDIMKATIESIGTLTNPVASA